MNKEKAEKLVKKVKVVYGPRLRKTEGNANEVFVRVPFCGFRGSVLTKLREQFTTSLREGLIEGLSEENQADQTPGLYLGPVDMDMKEVYTCWLHAVTSQVETWTGIIVNLRYADLGVNNELYAWAPEEELDALKAHVRNDETLLKQYNRNCAAAYLSGAAGTDHLLSLFAAVLPSEMKELELAFLEAYEPTQFYRPGELQEKYKKDAEFEEYEKTLEEKEGQE